MAEAEPGVAAIVTLDPTEKLQVNQPVTPFLLQYLEDDAQRLAANMANLMGMLGANVHAMSGITKEYVEAHRMATENLGEGVDLCIKQMSSLIVKCNEISENMEPVETLCAQIRTIKKTLDVLENAASHP
eukprot:m.6223 g.6223  ORF g.6223 m.6223 type:complete len:130 (-) comp2077_c0_seq1:142-531(-)